MRKVILSLAIVASLMSFSSSDEPLTAEVPNAYSFSRNGNILPLNYNNILSLHIFSFV